MMQETNEARNKEARQPPESNLGRILMHYIYLSPNSAINAQELFIYKEFH
jgi:hypothetical protein